MRFDNLQLPNSLWIVYMDERKNKLYYYNPETEERTYTIPNEFESWKSNAIDIILKSINWRKASNDKGRLYYYDKATKKTQWEPPQEIVEFEEAITKITQSQYKARRKSASSTSFKTSVDSVLTTKVEVQKEQIAIDQSHNLQSDQVDDLFGENGDSNINEVSNTENMSLAQLNEESHDHDERDDDSFYNDDEDNDAFEETPEQSDVESEDRQNRSENMESGTIDASMDYDTIVRNNSHSFGEYLVDETVNNEEEIKRLTSILCKRDSILEPDVVQNTKRLRSLTNENPSSTVKRLADNYVGYAAMSNILSEWLILAKLLNEEPSITKPSTTISAADQLKRYEDFRNLKQKQINDQILKEVSVLLKHKFDRAKADAIILQMSDIPVWLLAMMNDEILRKTLIELYNMNSDSTLLGFALRQLSKLGYHHEIAHIIREFEYLDVFNDIIVDIISRLAKADTLQELKSFVNDVTKNCTGNEYLFVYTIEILSHIQHTISNQNLDTSNQTKYTTISNRIRRVMQELEEHIIWKQLPTTSTASVSTTVLMPPSQLALRMIGRNLIINGNTDMTMLKVPSHLEKRGISCTDILTLLLDVLIMNIVTEKQTELLFDYYNIRPNNADMNVEGVLCLEDYTDIVSLLQQNQIVRMLVKAFIHPNSNHSPKHLAYLLSIIASYEKNTGFTESVSKLNESSSGSSNKTSNNYQFCEYVASLESALLEIRECCKEVLLKGFDCHDFEMSSKLSSHMIHPFMSYMVLCWIEYCTVMDTGSDINQLSSDIPYKTFLNLVPLFYHLIIQAMKIHRAQSSDNSHKGSDDKSISRFYDQNAHLHRYQHPLCHRLICNILSKLSNSSNYSSELIDTNNDIIQRFVRDGYESLMYLMVCGYTLEPMNFIIDTVDTVDADNVRYILSVILSFQNPFSLTFLELLMKFLSKESIVKELHRSENFKHLLQFQQEFNNMKLFHQTIYNDNQNKYQAVLHQLDTIVQTCKSKFKY